MRKPSKTCKIIRNYVFHLKNTGICVKDYSITASTNHKGRSNNMINSNLLNNEKLKIILHIFNKDF